MLSKYGLKKEGAGKKGAKMFNKNSSDSNGMD
jgi:hypothetical protein